MRYNLSSNSLYLHTLPMSKLHQQDFWKVSGFVAGFVVTVLCLSRRTVLHTCHARMLLA